MFAAVPALAAEGLGVIAKFGGPGSAPASCLWRPEYGGGLHDDIW